jgi:hypothetical protein
MMTGQPGQLPANLLKRQPDLLGKYNERDSAEHGPWVTPMPSA